MGICFYIGYLCCKMCACGGGVVSDTPILPANTEIEKLDKNNDMDVVLGDFKEVSVDGEQIDRDAMQCFEIAHCLACYADGQCFMFTFINCQLVGVEHSGSSNPEDGAPNVMCLTN